MSGGDYFMPAYARMNAMGRHVQFGAASMTPHGGSPNWPTLAYQGRNDRDSTFLILLRLSWAER